MKLTLLNLSKLNVNYWGCEMTFLYIIAFLFLNAVIGCAVYTAIDDDEQSMFKWYSKCPDDISWFAQPLFLEIWPIMLVVYFKRKWSN